MDWLGMVLLPPRKRCAAMKFHKLIKLAAVVAALNLATTALSRDRDIDMLALQPDGYHKAALASGGTYQVGAYYSPPKYMMADLKQLADASSTIVFRLTSAAQGIFEVAFDGQHLLSDTYIENDPLSDAALTGKAAFLEKVKSIVTATKGS
jgi:hypothetical protein